MTISFRKSFSAALLSGAVAIVTPVLAGGLILAQADNTNRPNSTGQVYTPGMTNGMVTAQPGDSAAQAAGANAAGSMNTNNGMNATGTGPNAPGTYGGMGVPPEVRNPMRTPNGIPNLYNSGTAPPDPLAKKPATPPQPQQ